MNKHPSKSETVDPVIIKCRNLTKYYGEGVNRFAALKELNIDIYRGNLHLLMGPSGSGKTTLISIMAGMLTQDAGECLIDHIDLNHLPDREKVHYRGTHIGFVFQSFNLVPSLTNEENIAVPLLATGVPRAQALKRACQLLADFDMADKGVKYPTELSGGQQQRIAIARALIHHPPIIVCDEPTSALDHHTGAMIMELLKEMTLKEKVTIIVVTHDPRIVQFADKIDNLEDGKVILRDKDSKDNKDNKDLM